jgi:aryl-alcohol dehydrogenase-like predicted oxidoreductase
MKTRPFGASAREVSEVGLGCWQLGGADWGDLDDQRAFEILHAAADAGITFLDTADVYGLGRSETLIGKFLRERKDGFFVATKLGRMADLYPDKYSEAGVRAATEASLRRLGVESLDLTQLHCVPPSILARGEIFDLQASARRQNQKLGRVSSMDGKLSGPIWALLLHHFQFFRQSPFTSLPKKQKRVGIIVRLLAGSLLAAR